MKNLFEALSKFQSKVKNPSKEKKGVHGASYAPIEIVWDEARLLLGEFGLALIQFPISKLENDKYFVGLRSILTHSSGESLTDEFFFPQPLIDAQKMGGTITYLRRYSICAILGITPENEDLDADNIDTQAVKKAHEIVNKDKPKTDIATDAQINLIRKLGGTPGKGMSKKDASNMIEKLQNKTITTDEIPF